MKFFLVNAVGLIAFATTAASPAELKPATLAAFDRYVTLTEKRMAGEMSGASPFLWIERRLELHPVGH